MINAIKYAPSGTFDGSWRKGNWLILNPNFPGGPTSDTGFYNRIQPPEGGYTLYLNKESNGPSIYVFTGNTELLNFCNNSLGASQTDIIGTLDWIGTQNDYFVDPNYFHFTADVASEGTFTLPIQSTNTPTINCVVDWGDGTTSTITSWDSASKTHTYPPLSGGTTVPIYGPDASETSLGYFDSSPSATYIILNDFFGESLPIVVVGEILTVETYYGTFVVIITDVIISSGFEMEIICTGNDINRYVFDFEVISISIGGVPPATYDIKIAGQISNLKFIDYQNLRDIKSWGCLDISLPELFKFSQNVTCTAVDSPRITTTSLLDCFNSCVNFNGAIGNWDVSSVTDMTRVFVSSQSFNQPIGNWDTSSVTTMERMFNDSRAFNQPIGNWDTSSVTTMSQMFDNARAFNQPIGNWDTSSVTTMYQMFNESLVFNQNIGSWNTSSVNNTYRMFSQASAFNQDIGDWDVSSVTNMRDMFYLSTAFNQDIGDWDVSNTTDFGIFVFSPDYSPLYMDSIYNKWSQLNVVSGRNINFANAQYTSAGAAGRSILVNTFGWTITDGGQV